MSIADAVARAGRYLTEHPEEARYRDSAATARVTSGLVVEVSGPGGESLRTDMPTGIGGTATVPSPGWYFRAATAACVASLLAIRAASTGVELASIEVEVDSESDDRGIFGVGEDVPAGPLSSRIVVRAAGGADAAAIEEVARWAVDHCPVSDAIRRAVPVELRVEVGAAAPAPS